MRRKALLAAKIDALSDLVRGIEDDHYPIPLDYVQALRMIRDTAESALREAVPSAVADGATWAQVGRALDVTPQAAHQRYAQT